MSVELGPDVKPREGSELQLQAAEQCYREVFEYNPEPMWLVDYASLQVLAVNRAAEQAYGYSRAEFLARTIAFGQAWQPSR